MNRINEEFVYVRNPGYKKLIYEISLSPKDVDLIVFITKNPQPIIEHLDNLNDYKLAFQITINPYGKDIEPNVPDVDFVIDSFIDVSKKIGKEKMIWRYDPIILDEQFDLKFHVEKYSYIANKIKPYVNRCVSTFLDVYEKHEDLYFQSKLKVSGEKERISFLNELSKLAKDLEIKQSFCSTATKYNVKGITHEPCLNEKEMIRWGIPITKQTTPMRPGCKCVKSIDIGEYDTCMHNCIYCYANTASQKTRENKHYDKKSEILFGKIEKDDIIKKIDNKCTKLSDY